MIRSQLPDVTQHPALLSVFRVGHLEQSMGAADKVKAGNGGVQDDVVEAGNSTVDVVGEGELGIGHTEDGVKIGAAEIGIDHDDSFAAFGEHHAEVGGEHRFADATLTSADRPDPRTVVAQITVENVDHCSQQGGRGRHKNQLRARAPWDGTTSYVT